MDKLLSAAIIGCESEADLNEDNLNTKMKAILEEIVEKIVKKARQQSEIDADAAEINKLI